MFATKTQLYLPEMMKTTMMGRLKWRLWRRRFSFMDITAKHSTSDLLNMKWRWIELNFYVYIYCMFVSPMPYKSTALRRYDIISITAVFNVNYAYGIRIQFIFFLQTLKNEQKKSKKTYKWTGNQRIFVCNGAVAFCSFVSGWPCALWTHSHAIIPQLFSNV